MIEENKAKEYADNLYPDASPNNAPYHTTGDSWDDCRNAFIAGYEAAESDAREKAVRVHSKFCHFKIDDKCKLSDFHTECSLIPNCNYKTNFLNHYNNE